MLAISKIPYILEKCEMEREQKAQETSKPQTRREKIQKEINGAGGKR